MNLYIEVENGRAKNHPAMEENLILAFGTVPKNWEPFVRMEDPVLDEDKTFDDPKITYEKVNGVWTDVFHIRDKTAEEKAADRQLKIDAYKAGWERLPQKENFSAWVFNEEKIQYEPPIARPAPDQNKLNAGINTFWCGAENNWKDTPVKPSDNNQYKFDFIAWKWVSL